MHRPMVEQIWAREQILHRMLLRLGIDIATAARRGQGTAYSVARTNCIKCENAALCEAWLQSAVALDQPPACCRNSLFFADFRSS